MAEAGNVEDAGNKAIILDSPAVENKENVNIEEDDLQHTKIGLNRSMSCGSILQGNGMSKKLSRRVSFPSDDKLISGYNEPKNPWEHAHETTTEDLIQAYTQACQTWNVRPITKLLLQLQEIRDFTVRANSLTLKGEKLEMRVVETLESIFKRVQFITIDLEATNLDEDAGASLFDMIEYYESAVNVLVGFNKNLGNRGWQAAAHMMRKMSCLRLFDGHSVPLSIQASPFVGRALRLSNTLVTLHLENAMLSGRPILLIVAALRMNTTLRELFLADNRLTPLDALQLANLLKFNRILQLLDLRNNPIQDMGLGHLCAGLMAQTGSAGLNGASGGLQTLVLWNNQISLEGMPKLAMALRYTVSLSTLNLGQNVLSDDGILRLKEGLLQNHSLLRLGLVGTKLTDEGAVAIAEYLAESPRIIRLDLRNNDIKVAGLMALSLAFKINYSLLRLDIDKPNKKDALKELAAKQESLMNDIVTYSMRNKQAALEKAQAAQLLQEQLRKGESELRYMDMTNASTSTSEISSSTIVPSTSSTEPSETSANNSNNQSPIVKIKTQQVKDSKSSSDQQAADPNKPSNSDDSPENSPELLPRNSVSYHQVSPVMLSNSEMAKRAAAAKLKPVPEQHEEGTPPPAGKFLSTAVTKMVDDAFIGAKLSLAAHDKPAADSEAPAEISKLSELDAASSGEPEATAQSTEANCETVFSSKPDTTAELSVKLESSRTAENANALDSLAERLTELVMTNTTTPVPNTDTSLPNQPNDLTDEVSDLFENQVQDEHRAELVPIPSQEPITAIETTSTNDVPNTDGAKLVQSTNNDMVTGVVMTDTTQIPSTNGAETNQTGARIPNGAIECSPLTTNDPNYNITNVDLKPGPKIICPNAPQVGDSPDIDIHQGILPNSQKMNSNKSVIGDAPNLARTPDQETSISEEVGIESNDISSGLGTEDNSVISCDLSPVDDKIFADKAAELLTPDSGMVHFDVHKEHDKIGEPNPAAEKELPDPADDVAEGEAKPATDIERSTVISKEEQSTDVNNQHSKEFPELESKLENLEIVHKQTPEISSEQTEISGEKHQNDDFIQNMANNSTKDVVNNLMEEADSTQCEVEISHYSLKDFSNDD